MHYLSWYMTQSQILRITLYKWAIWNYKWNTISFWKTEKLVKLMLNKSQCIHMWLHWLLQISNFTRQKNLWNWCWTKVNVLTCDYIDFCLAHVTTLTVIYKIYENCAITFNLHGKLFYSVATIVVFNNVLCWNQFSCLEKGESKNLLTEVGQKEIRCER